MHHHHDDQPEHMLGGDHRHLAQLTLLQGHLKASLRHQLCDCAYVDLWHNYMSYQIHHVYCIL